MAIVQKSLAGNPALQQPGVQAMMKLGQYVGAGLGALLLLWPIIVLYYMSRPPVKAAFERGWVEGMPAAGTQMMPPQPPPYA